MADEKKDPIAAWRDKALLRIFKILSDAQERDISPEGLLFSATVRLKAYREKDEALFDELLEERDRDRSR
jgi:hypothetical protein